MSILEQIIAEKEEKAKQDFNPQEALNTLLAQALSQKEQEILELRFALVGGEKKTLEKIGQQYGVTRERIRQIEKQAIKKIKSHTLFNQIFQPVERFLIVFFDEFGGFLGQKFLFAQFFNEQERAAQNILAFILDELLTHRFVSIKQTGLTKLGWKLKHLAPDFLEKIKEELRQIFVREKRPLDLETIWQNFQKSNFYGMNKGHLNIKTLQSVLTLFQDFACNPFGGYGLSNSSQVTPKRIHDRILLILRKERKPLHFREIARKIEEVFKKKAYAPTVHNELILNKEYVLVGRGIYALVEWGYKPGVVADIIESILREENRPLTRQEITERVLKQRMVKTNTIYLALTNKQRFKKLKDNCYAPL